MLDDDPQLDVRLVDTVVQPLRVLIDSRLEVPLDARILAPPGKALIFFARAEASRVDALQDRGAELDLVPGPDGKVDLGAMLNRLAERKVNELHVEAGHRLNASFLREGLVDELLVYIAPSLIGPGRDMAALAPLQDLAGALPLTFTEACRVGADLRIRALVPRR